MQNNQSVGIGLFGLNTNDIVYNNVIRNNNGGIFATGHHYIYHNTIYGHPKGGIGSHPDHPTPATVKNNLIFQSIASAGSVGMEPPEQQRPICVIARP